MLTRESKFIKRIQQKAIKAYSRSIIFYYILIASLKAFHSGTQFLFWHFDLYFQQQVFKILTQDWGEKQASLSNMIRSLRSIELRSGVEGVHTSLLQELGRIVLNHSRVILNTWEKL